MPFAIEVKIVMLAYIFYIYFIFCSVHIRIHVPEIVHHSHSTNKVVVAHGGGHGGHSSHGSSSHGLPTDALLGSIIGHSAGHSGGHGGASYSSHGNSLSPGNDTCSESDFLHWFLVLVNEHPAHSLDEVLFRWECGAAVEARILYLYSYIHTCDSPLPSVKKQWVWFWFVRFTLFASFRFVLFRFFSLE